MLIIDASPQLWTPVNLPAGRLSFWQDANDISTVILATGVSEWRDKSGNGRHFTQTVGANQPAYSSTAFFGLPGITFDGINDQLNLSTTVGQNLTHGVYWVFARRGPGSGADVYRPTIGILHASNGDSGALHYVNPSSRGASYPYYQNPTSGNYDNAQLYSNNVPYLMAFQANGTGWGVWRDGIIEGTTTPTAGVPNTNNVGYTIARQNNISRWSNNVYAEILMIQNANASIRDLVKGYFAWKWNLQTNLPTAHPFRNRPPLVSDM